VTLRRLVNPILVTMLLSALALALVPAAGAAANAPAWPFIDPSLPWTTDGQTVAWLTHGDTQDEFDLNVRDLTIGASRIVAQNLCDQAQLSIDGHTLIWTSKNCDNWNQQDLFVLNLDTSDLQHVENVPSTTAEISGKWIVTDVVNNSGSGGSVSNQFQARSLSDLEHAQTVTTVDGPVSNFKFSNGRIAWVEPIDSGWVLKSATIDNPTIKTIASDDRPDLFSFDLYGDVVVWTDKWSLHAMNLSTNAAVKIPGRAKDSTTNGRFVFWEDTRFIDEGNDADLSRSDIWAYDMMTSSTFPVTAPPQSGFFPNSRGDLLTWFGGSVGTVAVWIDTVVPSTQRPDPGKTSNDWLYFSPTGHYLSFGFKNFWQASGGLPVFGYPLTEEFTQNGFTVQYLERQRFEIHPEFAGTPYETELGLLGTEAAESAGLLNTPPFEALPASTGSDANCDFVVATGHRLCGEFKHYWQSHGLDFGDSGDSYRESLALFGYPISDEFTDSGTGLTVQYFERAVFEFHPDNPAPYRVELRLLGSATLATFAW